LTKKIDPRVKRTKEMLRQALLELIAEKGYESISVSDITKRAGLNRTTFYLHYRDKEDLLFSSIKEILSKLDSGIAERKMSPAHYTETQWKGEEPFPDLEYLFKHVAEHQHFYHVMFANNERTHFLLQLLNILLKAFGTPQEQAHTLQLITQEEILYHYASSAYLGIIYLWLKNHLTYSHRYMAIQLRRLRLPHIKLHN
jgi:AcrR family transcriptional regulator